MMHEKLNIRGLKRGNVFLSYSSFPPVVGLSHVVTSRFHHHYIGLTFPWIVIGTDASIEPLNVKYAWLSWWDLVTWNHIQRDFLQKAAQVWTWSLSSLTAHLNKKKKKEELTHASRRKAALPSFCVRCRFIIWTQTRYRFVIGSNAAQQATKRRAALQKIP